MKTHLKTARGKGLIIPSRTTAGGSSPFPWSVSEVDAALRSLSPPSYRGPGGVHCARLRRTSRLAFGLLCSGRGGHHCAPLRRTSHLGLPVAGITGGRCMLSCHFGLESFSLDRINLTDVDPHSNLPRHRQHSLFLRRRTDIGSVPSSVAAAAQLLRAVGPCMAFLATPVESSHWGTTFGAAAAEPPPSSLVPLPLRPCFPRARFFRCRGLHLFRGRHLYHRRRAGHAQSLSPASCFQKVGDVALAQP